MLCTPINPMVFMIIIPIKWLFHWEYTLFSDKPISVIPYIHGEYQWKYVELQDHDFSWEIGKFVNKDTVLCSPKIQGFSP